MSAKNGQMCKIRIFIVSDPRPGPGEVLHFCGQCSIFAETKNQKNMKRHITALEYLVRLMQAEPSLSDFPAACRRLHLTPGIFNELLLRETGFCGEEIFLQMRVE